MDVVGAVRAHVVGHFGGGEPQSASVTFLGVEPIEVLRFPGADGVSFATLGCARHPMGDPSSVQADPVRGPRVELVLELRGGLAPEVFRSLAVLAAAPAVEAVVLQPDALIDLGEPLWQDSRFTAVVLGVSDVPELPLGEPMDPVRFLTATPVTATEAAWVRVRGAAALRDAWREAGIDPRNPARPVAPM